MSGAERLPRVVRTLLAVPAIPPQTSKHAHTHSHRPSSTSPQPPPKTVVLACRSRAKGDALAKLLAGEAAAAGREAASVEVASLDLDSLSSVRAFVDAWEASGRPVHMLINNAGVFHMGGAGKKLAPCLPPCPLP